MSDVFVNIHGGCDTVIGDVFVVIRTRLAVYSVYTWDRHSLIAPCYVPEKQGDEEVTSGLKKGDSKNVVCKMAVAVSPVEKLLF